MISANTESPPLALLAGGLAKRLRPITETIPKAMVEVAGEPFIAHQLRLLKREGISHVVICAGYLGEQIQDFVKDGARFGLTVEYSFDGDELLGTGGALKKAFPRLDEYFWVMYGDTYLDISFPPILGYFNNQNASGLMTVLKNKNQWDKSNVLLENYRIVNYNKAAPTPAMHHIDYGLGLLKKSAFSPWKDQRVFDLADVYQGLVEAGDLLGFEVDRRFYEIGTSEGLEQTTAYLKGIQK